MTPKFQGLQMSDDNSATDPGVIVTFYSFKGGVGRSMALSNIACLLAMNGQKVLVVDWDLEAPGLREYFTDRNLQGSMSLRTRSKGIVDYLYDVSQERTPDWERLVETVSILDFQIDAICVSDFDDDYRTKLQNLDWNDLYENAGLGEALERFRDEVIDKYDFVLIDSRTGVSDIGDICTVILPDILVPVFVSNNQSVDGSLSVIQRATKIRNSLPVDRSRLLVLPLSSRDESDSEYDTAHRWREYFTSNFNEILREWLPKEVDPKDYFDQIYLPYVPFWSFGERLPVVEGARELKDPNSLGSSYFSASQLIQSGLDWYALREKNESMELVSAKAALSRVEAAYEIERKRPNRFSTQSVFLYTLLSAGLVVGLLSGYLIYLGVSDILLSSSVLPALFSATIQLGIFALVWPISGSLFDGKLHRFPAIIFVFIVLVFLSTSFSYVGIYKTLGLRSSELLAQQIQSNLLAVSDRTANEYENSISSVRTDFSGSQALRDWSKGISDIVAVARDLEDVLEAELARRLASAYAQRDEIAQKISDLNSRLSGLTASKGSSEARIETAQSRLDSIRTNLSSITTELITVSAEVTASQEALDTEIRTGFGPRARAMELELNSLQADALRLENQATRLTGEIAELETTLSAENSELSRISNEILAVQREKQDFESQLPSFDAVISELRSRQSTGSNGGFLLQLAASAQSGSIDDYAAAVDACRAMLVTISNVDNPWRSPPNCSALELDTMLSTYTALTNDFHRYSELCQQEQFVVARGEASSEKLGQIIDVAFDCARQVPNAQLRAEILAEVDRVSQLADNSGSSLTRAIQSFNSGSIEAILAAIIALSLDITLLFLAIFARRISMPTYIRHEVA